MLYCWRCCLLLLLLLFAFNLQMEFGWELTGCGSRSKGGKKTKQNPRRTGKGTRTTTHTTPQHVYNTYSMGFDEHECNCCVEWYILTCVQSDRHVHWHTASKLTKHFLKLCIWRCNKGGWGLNGDNCVGHKVIGHEVFVLNVFSARALSILFGTQLNFLLCTLVPCADSFVIPLFCYVPVAPSNINSFKQSFKSHLMLFTHLTLLTRDCLLLRC